MRTALARLTALQAAPVRTPAVRAEINATLAEIDGLGIVFVKKRPHGKPQQGPVKSAEAVLAVSVLDENRILRLEAVIGNIACPSFQEGVVPDLQFGFDDYFQPVVDDRLKREVDARFRQPDAAGYF